MPRIGQTVSAAERKQALSNAMRELVNTRYAAANKPDDSSEGEEPPTKEQRSAEYELAVAARDMGLPKPPPKERVYESPLRVSDSGNRLVSKGPETGPPTTAVGNRIVDVQLMAEALGPHLCCSECNRRGCLTLSREHERKIGFASVLKWWCRDCNVVSIEQETSRVLPRQPEQAQTGARSTRSWRRPPSRSASARRRSTCSPRSST
jgi:hypothetical protein